MAIKIGEVAALFRYPVKSMGGERLDSVAMSWHGLEGDRRLALRRAEDQGGFPFLTAGRLPELILYSPVRRNAEESLGLPTHVRTPEGVELEVFGEELARDVGRRVGSPVQMMHFKHGIFDEASLSVITTSTIDEIGRLAEQPPDPRRFGPNIVISSAGSSPFEEDAWVGGVLSFGEGCTTPALAVTLRDERCSMVNLNPDSARPDPEILRAIVRQRDNKAGVYGTVTRCGDLAVGQSVFLEASSEPR